MTALEDPRTYVLPKPVSQISHKGLRITARSDVVYTACVPDRHQVAQQNYYRRSYQMKKCGYNSLPHKPYQTVGKVFLDDKDLILVTLGQKQCESPLKVLSNINANLKFNCLIKTNVDYIF